MERIVATFFPNANQPHFINCGPFIASPQNNTRLPSSSLPPATANNTVLPTPPVTSRIQPERIPESPPRHEIYARELLLAKRGYPLWKPKAQGARLPRTYKQEGVQIGDVGILNEFGGFSYLFNIFHPADHPNNIGRTPPEFTCLPAEVYLDVEEVAEEFELGAHVTTGASKISRRNIPFHHGQAAIPRVTEHVGAGLSFTSAATQGALLILPEGGKRIDHQQWTSLLNYTAESAQSWYEYVNGERDQGGLARGVHSGLYLVTGCDKARAWGVASFNNVRPPEETAHLEFVPTPATGNAIGAAPQYRFSVCNFAESSSDADSLVELQSGCVFLRGFRIAIRDRPKNPFIPFSPVEVTSISEMYPGAITRMGSTESASHLMNNIKSRMTGNQPNYPVRHEVYHPLDVINEWILNNYDEVDVTITHDEDWTSTIREGRTEMPRNSELIEIAKKNLRFVQGNRCKYACIRRIQQNISQNVTSAENATPMTLTQLELAASGSRDNFTDPSSQFSTADPSDDNLSSNPGLTRTESSTSEQTQSHTSKRERFGRSLSRSTNSIFPLLFRDAHVFTIQGGSFYSGGPPPNPTPCDEIDAYLRFLLPKRLGYPLWSPKPGNWLPPAYREHGVCIGDVGFPTEHGSFSYQFNVGLPPNDALNVGRVPRDFIQLEGVHDSENWMWSDNDLKPGGFIASNFAHFRKTIIPPGPRYVPIAPPEVGAGLSFDTTASRGALLILPEGGVRYNHQQKMIFFEHATRYAKSWFNHINHVLHQGVSEIYLITGCDKTRAWGVASFLGARDPRDVYLEYVPQAPVTPGRRPSYRFRRHDSASASAGVDDFFENQSGCTFLRGYKITMREEEEGQNPDITHYTEWGGSGGGGGGGRGGGGGKPHPPGPSGGRGVSKRRKSYRAEYHPSSTMNKWVLKMHQDIDIAITHDDDWTDLIDENDGEIPDDKELIQRLSSRKQLCRLSHGGYTFAYFRNASEVQIKDVRSIVASPLSKQGSTSNIGAGVSSVVGTVNTLVSILERGFMGPGDTGERAATIIRECREFIQKASINDKHYLMEAEDIFYEQMEDSLNAAARNKERLQHLATLDRKREPEYIQWANVSRTIESLLSDLTRLRKKLQLASDTNHGSPISPKTHQFATVSGSYTAPQVVRNTSGGSTVYNSGLQGGGYAMNPSYPVPVAATTSANWSHTSTSGSTSHRTSGTYPYGSSDRRLSSTSLGGTGHARNASLDNLSISGTNRDPGFSSRILSKIKSPFKSSDNTSAYRMAGGNIPSARNSATDLSTSPRATRRDSFTKENAEGGSHTARTHRSSSRSRHDPSERSSMYDSVSGSMESLRIHPEDRRHSSYSNTTTTPQTFPAPSQSLTTTEMYEQKRLERSKKHRPKKDGR